MMPAVAALPPAPIPRPPKRAPRSRRASPGRLAYAGDVVAVSLFHDVRDGRYIGSSAARMRASFTIDLPAGPKGGYRRPQGASFCESSHSLRLWLLAGGLQHRLNIGHPNKLLFLEIFENTTQCRCPAGVPTTKGGCRSPRPWPHGRDRPRHRSPIRLHNQSTAAPYRLESFERCKYLPHVDCDDRIGNQHQRSPTWWRGERGHRNPWRRGNS